MMKVIIVDDQALMRQGLTMMLSRAQDIQVVAQGGDGLEAVELCDRHKPDVILMDIRMPGMNGVEATKIIKEKHPDIQVLILTTFNDDSFIFGSLKNGASGYLLKDATPEEILTGIRTVHGGGSLMNPNVAAKVVQKLNRATMPSTVDKRVETLTERERDICHHLALGLNNQEIGEELFISEGTVKNNITKILDKLSLRDRTQLALFAVKNGL